MPGKYYLRDERVRIIAWRQDHVSIKTICERTGRAKSTVMKILSAARGLPPDEVYQSKNILMERRERLAELQTSF